MTSPGTYAKRQRKRRAHCRAIDRALVRKYGRDAFPGIGPIVWMGRVIHILMKLSTTTGSIGGRSRVNDPVILDDLGPPPDPEVLRQWWRDRPKNTTAIIGPFTF